MAEPKKTKDGMYRIRVRLRHPITGKWIERSTTQKTKKLCKEWEVKIRSETLIGVNPDKVKLLTFFDMWFETFKRHAVGPDHIRKIDKTRKYIVDFFGPDILIHQLDRIKYQNFINHLGSAEHKNLAVATVRDHHKIFKSCLVEAQDYGYLRVNPARNIKIIGRDTSGERKKTLTMEEWKKLLHAILASKDSSSKFVALTMMFIGARFQEVDGLLVSDIDFKDKTIRINKAFDYKRTKDFTPTKTAGSVRTVDMPDTLVSILKEYVTKRKSNTKIVSISRKEDEKVFLFPGDLGTPITNKALNQYLTRMCQKANIDRVTSHAFRHAKTDMLVLAGADMVYTQKQLGHADAATTLKYYSELNLDIRTKNKDIQERFLNSNLN